MRRVRGAAATTATTLDAPVRRLTLDSIAEPPRNPRPTPPPPPGTADRIREALLRWLEEDM